MFEPAAENEGDGCEDSRLTELEGQLVMAYTALRENDHGLVFQIALTTIAKNDFINRQWNWGARKLPFPGIRNKDAGIFPQKIDGRYVMLHRIEPDIV